MGGTEGTTSHIFTAAELTAALPYEMRFGGNLEWIRFQNDSPETVTVLGHDENEVLFHILPGDILPFHFGAREYNSLRMFASDPTGAADILAGNILYVHYKLKIRGH